MAASNIDTAANEKLKAENLFTVPGVVAVITGGGSGEFWPTSLPFPFVSI